MACRRSAPLPQPPLVAQVSGTLKVPGLTAPVRVVRDTWGVPHIYAEHQADLFLAQGFVQAQDRLFQMDLWRRASQGRLSEVLGPNFIERDAMTRRIQYRGDLDEEWASYGPDAKAIAEAFVRGVNAWVALARQRPPEEFVLAGWRPDPWSADDLLSRTDAFTSSGAALDEVFRSRLIAAVGLVRARQLLPGDRALEATGAESAIVPALAAEMIRRVGTPPFFLGLAAPVTEGTVRLKPDTTDVDGTGFGRGGVGRGGVGRGGVGSVRLQPDRDPVHVLAHPSLRYLVHLNAPGWNVIGATAPWHPGVAAGHNDRIAWTSVPIDSDAQDVYVEKLNPSNPRQVEDGGRWVDIDVRQDVIAVRGRRVPVDFTCETTPHGVIVASDLERHLAFAIRWPGSAPGAAADMAATTVDRATSWEEFRAALARWKMPATRMSYRDVDGRRTTAGPAPSRATAAREILESARLHPDRADALLQTLASLASSKDSLKAQRAAVVDALAEALHDRAWPAGQPVMFAHPLGVTAAARRRFNVSAPARTGGAADPLAMFFDTADWDRTTAINAPGQSGSPESLHFADLLTLWSEGKSFPLAFSDTSVQAHATATLVLTPK